MALSAADIQRIKSIFDEIPKVDPGVLVSMQDDIRRNKEFIEGNGKDGAKVTIRLMKEDIAGLKEDFEEFKRELGVLRSDVRETLNLVRGPVKEKKNWFVDKVLPGLVQTLIIAICTAFFVLIVQHASDLIK